MTRIEAIDFIRDHVRDGTARVFTYGGDGIPVGAVDALFDIAMMSGEEWGDGKVEIYKGEKR